MAFKIGKSATTAFLLMTYCSVAEEMRLSCSETSVITGTVQIAETKDPYISTVIYSPLQQGQTLCYDLIVEGKEKSGTMVFISVINIEQEYDVKFGYNFSIPTMEVKCMCDCPGWDDKCNRGHEGESCAGDYGSGSGDCAKKYSNGYTDAGCDYLDPSEVCCDIEVYKQESKPDYAAVYVGNPLTMYTLEVGFAADSGNIINKSKRFELSSHSLGAITEVGVVGIVGQAVENAVIIPGWYFMDYEDRVLRTGEPINDLNENNVNKLGWYKFDQGGQLLPLDWNGLRKSLSTKVSHCGRDEITWHSSSSFFVMKDHSQETIGQPVKNVSSITTQVRVDERSIRVHVDSTLPFFLHSRINASGKVIFRQHKSIMANFEAEIVLDRFGNKKLLLFLMSASGLFYGSIEPDKVLSQSFTVVVASKKPIDTTKTLKISLSYTCPPGTEIKVCLSTAGNKWIQCQMAPCREEKLTEAKHQDNSDNPTNGISSNTVKTVLEQFQEKLQTIKDTVMGWIGWIVDNIQMLFFMVTAFIGIVLFIAVCCCLSKFGLCCLSSCCHFKCRKKKRKQKRRNDTDEVDSPPAKDTSSYVLHAALNQANEDCFAVQSSSTPPEKKQESNEVKLTLTEEKNDDGKTSCKLKVANEDIDEVSPILTGSKSDDDIPSWSLQVIDKNADDVFSLLTKYSSLGVGAYLDLPAIDEELC